MLTVLREVLNDVSDNFRSWTDTRLLMYLAEGQDKFCEDTGYFRDALSFTLTLVDGTDYYAIPDRVIQVISIYNGTAKLEYIPTGEEYYSDDAGTSPRAWLTDQESGLIRIIPTPGADQAGIELSLRVWRYSHYDLSGLGAVPEGGGTAPPAEPEIPSRFHGAPIEWAAYRALMHHDEETQDPVKASDHLNAYKNIYVADGRRAFNRYHNVEAKVSVDPAYRT